VNTEQPPVLRPLRAAGRVFTRALLIVVAVIGAIFCFFVCQGVFSGYPKYHTGTLSIIGMILIALTGGVAWVIDERRGDGDG
jgi:hypothetical protein